MPVRGPRTRGNRLSQITARVAASRSLAGAGNWELGAPIAPGFTAGFLAFSLALWIQQRVRPVGGGLQMDHNQNVMCSWEIPCVRRKPSALRHSGMVAEHGGPLSPGIQ